MKRLVLVMLLALAAGQAQETGSRAFALLRTGYGASVPALGGTGTAWGEDVGAMWCNPASLEGLASGEVMLGYRSWLARMHDEFMGFAWPGRRSTFGLAAFYSLVEVERWDESNQPQGSLYPQCGVLDVVWSYSLRRGFSIGLGSKLLYENLVEVQGLGAVFDAGMWWRPLDWFSAGAALHDVGTGVLYADERVATPWSADAGIALRISPGVSVSAGGSYVSDAGFKYGLGVEYRPLRALALRAGGRFSRSVAEWGVWAAPSCGLALYWQGFKVEYALVPYGVLGATHTVSVSRRLAERPATADVLVKVVSGADGFTRKAHLRTRGAFEEERDIAGVLRRNWLEPGWLHAQAEAAHHYAASDSVLLRRDVLNVLVLELDSIPYGVIKGVVREEATKAPAEATIYFKGEVEDSTRSDPVWGTYESAPLPPGEYLVRVMPTQRRLSPSLTRLEVAPGDTATSDLYVYRERRADVLMTLYLNFETGKADILPAYAPMLDSIAPVLRENADRGLVIEIAGHTDNVPVVYSPYGDNQRLSEARAEAVKRYLVEKHGLSETMFRCRGYGDSEPMASNETPEGRAMNRRIEFRLITKEQ